MGDNRYHELLGLDASIESPTYYELLLLSPADATTEAVESHYKEQMTKLQHIKSPKHKGFIEFLKDELRNAKLTLTNADRRKEYDKGLGNKHHEAFKEFAKPFMALGEVPKKVFDTIVATGVSKHGLGEAEARQIVEEIAKAAGAKIASETFDTHAAEPAAAAPPPPPPPPAYAPPPPPAYAPPPPPASAPPPAYAPPGYAHSPYASHAQPAPARADGPSGEDVLAFFDQADDALHAGGSGPPPAPAPAYGHGHVPPHAPQPPSYVGTASPVADEPPSAAAYGYEDHSAAPQPHAPAVARFPRTTPVPAPGEGSPLEPPGRVARQTPAPPSDVGSGAKPRIQRGRFYDDSGMGLRSGPSSSSSDIGRVAEQGRGPSASDLDRRGATGPGKTSDRTRRDGYETPLAPPWQQQQQREASPFQGGAPTPSPAASARAAYQSQQEAKACDDARKSYNGGIKLAKIALQAHTSLGEYFPASGEMKQRVNDVSYEDVLRTEHKMWKEALPFFQKVLEKLGTTRGPLADDLRKRAEANIQSCEKYLKEWKDLKFKLEFQGVKRAEMLKLYREYVVSKRADAFKHEIEKPEGPVATA